MLPEVELKNGSRVPEPVARVVPRILQALAVEDVIAFYELVMLARNPQHNLWSEDVRKKLKERGFLESSNRVQNTLRQVILSAVEGDGLDMHLVDPVKA